MIVAAESLERILSSVVSFLFWIAPVVLFIVFLILFIINFRKVRKGEGKKGRTITFGVLSAVFLTYSIGEVMLILTLAAAVAHM